MSELLSVLKYEFLSAHLPITFGELAPAEFRKTKPDFKTAPMSTVKLNIFRRNGKN